MFTYHHTAVSVIDLNVTIEFYSIFGFKEVARWVAPDNKLRIVHLKLGEFILELFNYTEYKIPRSFGDDLYQDLQQIGVRHLALRVENIEEIRKLLTKKDLCNYDTQIILGRTGIRYFFIQDPNKIFVEIVEDKRNI